MESSFVNGYIHRLRRSKSAGHKLFLLFLLVKFYPEKKISVIISVIRGKIQNKKTAESA